MILEHIYLCWFHSQRRTNFFHSQFGHRQTKTSCTLTHRSNGYSYLWCLRWPWFDYSKFWLTLVRQVFFLPLPCIFQNPFSEVVEHLVNKDCYKSGYSIFLFKCLFMQGICLHHLFLIAKLAAVGVALVRHLVTVAWAIMLFVFLIWAFTYFNT